VDLPPDEVGSASIDAVAAAARAISAALDEADVPKGPHTLEVSTPGAERELTEQRHFLRARTRLAAITLTSGESFVGRVQAVENGTVTLDVDDEERSVAITDIAAAKVQLEMKRKG